MRGKHSTKILGHLGKADHTVCKAKSSLQDAFSPQAASLRDASGQWDGLPRDTPRPKEHALTAYLKVTYEDFNSFRPALARHLR